MEFVVIAGIIVGVIFWARRRTRKASDQREAGGGAVAVESSMLSLDGDTITVRIFDRGVSEETSFKVSEILTVRLVEGQGKSGDSIQFVMKTGLELPVIQTNPNSHDQVKILVEAVSREMRIGETNPNFGHEGSPVFADHEVPARTQLLQNVQTSAGGPRTIILENPIFAVVDVETTGRFPDYGDRIVQIAIVKIDSKGNILSSWSSLINPERRMAATHVHGITDSDVTHAPVFREVAAQILSELGESIFVAHNASFDYRFIRAELSQLGQDLNADSFAVFDTMSLAKKVYPDIPNKKLLTLLEYSGVEASSLPGGKSHSALTDAHAAAEVLRCYLNWNRRAVFRSIRWPLLDGNLNPEIKLVEDFEEELKRQNQENMYLEALKVQPGVIRIPEGAEVYFTGFSSEEEDVIESYLSEWAATRALRVTKSRCNLVVSRDSTWMSNSIRNAAKWGIPVVLLEYAASIEIEPKS